MEGKDLFDELPDFFLKSLKQQMALGLLASETVEAILQPVLSSHKTVLPQLSLDMQTDIEDILRVYRAIAEKYHVDPLVSPSAILDALWGELRPAILRDLLTVEAVRLYKSPTDRSGDDDRRNDLLRHLKEVAAELPRHGRARFLTDKGSPVRLELFYEKETEHYCFQSSSLTKDIEIQFSGCHVLTLQPGRERGGLSLEKLLDIFKDIVGESTYLDLEIHEQ